MWENGHSEFSLRLLRFSPKFFDGFWPRIRTGKGSQQKVTNLTKGRYTASPTPRRPLQIDYGISSNVGPFGFSFLRARVRSTTLITKMICAKRNGNHSKPFSVTSSSRRWKSLSPINASDCTAAGLSDRQLERSGSRPELGSEFKRQE